MARGDQIYVLRKFLKLEGFYEHHGIDCGNGTVIHYRKPSETISRTTLATFAQRQKIYVREYPVGFCFIPETVVRRAESRLKERKYNLLFNNCEHFATWCKTGIGNSQQIRDFIPAIAKVKIDNLSQPIQEALGKTDPNNAQKLRRQALADIKVVWDDIQPQYKQAVEEITTTEKG